MCIYGYKTRVALPVRERNLENKKFKYVEVGAEEFFKPSAIIWIKDEELISYGYLEFPMKNVDLIQISEKHYVLTKGDKNLYYIIVNAPRGGTSEIEPSTFVNKTYLFKEYKSKKGRLGISAGALVLTKKEEITVKWTKEEEDGKKEKGIVSINIDGDVIEEELEITEETTSE
jgi:hypothetical protein